MKIINKINFVIVFFILSITTVTSQESKKEILTPAERHRSSAKNIQGVADLFDAEVYINSKNDTLRYRLLKPLNYNPNKKYPLEVCLSGTGGRAFDNIKQIASCWPAQVFAYPENRRNYEAFIFVPQCPPHSIWGKTLGEREKQLQIKYKRPIQEPIDSMVFEVIDVLKNEFNVDDKRLYVTGQSMGGYGTWHFILKYPKMFAAAVPICGGGNPELANTIVDVPVWAFHGETDTSIPAEYSRNMIESIKKSGGTPKYTEFLNVGHICWPLACDTPGLLDWMFAQKLN